MKKERRNKLSSDEARVLLTVSSSIRHFSSNYYGPTGDPIPTFSPSVACKQAIAGAVLMGAAVGVTCTVGIVTVAPCILAWAGYTLALDVAFSTCGHGSVLFNSFYNGGAGLEYCPEKIGMIFENTSTL